MKYVVAYAEYLGCPIHDSNGSTQLKILANESELVKWLVSNVYEADISITISINEKITIVAIPTHGNHSIQYVNFQVWIKDNEKPSLEFIIEESPYHKNTRAIRIGSEWISNEELIEKLMTVDTE